MKNRFANICGLIYDILYRVDFKEAYRMREKDFTRNRKMGFGDLCMMILRGSKAGLQAGINEFLKDLRSDIQSYSNAAFCKARQKINPDAFKRLTEIIVQEYYKSEKYVRLYKGYRVFAIDGSDFNLPNSDSLLAAFGSENFRAGHQVQAQVSCMYDVLNNVVVGSEIAPYNTSERLLAAEHLRNFALHEKGKDLVLMDRGYPSEELLKQLENQGYKYLLRSNRNEFFREVRKAAKPDTVIQRICKDKTVLHIRVATVQLKNDVTETLITNLPADEISLDELGEIYRLRWCVETAYDSLKNQFQIENFTGITPVCVKQDFYATIFLKNMLAFLEDECREKIDQINSNEELKYEYKLNSALAISTLKNNVVELFMAPSRRQFNKNMKRIRSQLLQCMSPVRPNRSFERKRRHPALKYPQNNKCS